MARVVFLFLDGVGIGIPDATVNPFFRAHLPTLSDALDGNLPSLDTPTTRGPGGRAFPLDACLGIEGIPQSGTGQIALLTGHNAPQLFGRHFGPWPPVRLRPLLEKDSFLSLAVDRGLQVAFANAYPRGFPGRRDTKRVAAMPLAAKAAGLLDRDHLALSSGEAVASEIVNDGWIHHLGHDDVPDLTAMEAGVNLARITSEHDLTLYAHYYTDAAGHRGGMSGAVAALERVDQFLGGLLARVPPDTVLIVASDHGNIEDVRGGHTRNPSLGLILGDRAEGLESPERLTDLAGFVLESCLHWDGSPGFADPASQ